MKWEVKTKLKTHYVENNSSKCAVDFVKEIDNSEIVSVTLVPKNLSGKVKRLFRYFTKR
jgi:hypothetical protein